MASNLFERLADLEVPPPPARFDEQLHERVNRSLVIAHLVDLACKGLPWAMAHFLRAVVALIGVTLTGRLETNQKDGHRKGPPT